MPPAEREGIEDLALRIRSRDRRALSRAISWIEDQTPAGRLLLDRVYSPEGRAHRLGITGPPGSGKSTLVSQLTRLLRARGVRVAVLAVDPSSPFTGGAVLGDRIRMQDHAGDPDVFIRSMASRGSLGGLASTTYEVSEAVEAAGYDWILIETVGVGQSEMEIVEAADTTLVVLVPESGDGVQVMKAGLMEAADLFVVNKYDRDGGDRLIKEISLMLELGREQDRERRGAAPGANEPRWERRIHRTVASTGLGVPELLGGIDAHRAHLRSDPERWQQRQRRRLRRRLRGQLRDRLLQVLERDDRLEGWLREGERRIVAGEASPYGWIDAMASRLLEGERSFEPAAPRREER
ncbi:MAG: methylmalonyl Co-A mutase-associated GTPase MeaB [Candidatus Eisenbacteria bacterium]